MRTKSASVRRIYCAPALVIPQPEVVVVATPAEVAPPVATPVATIRIIISIPLTIRLASRAVCCHFMGRTPNCRRILGIQKTS